MDTVSTATAFGGVQGVYTHQSSVCACDMTFAVYMPPQTKAGPVPVLWYLSGLTCSHANVMDKGEYRAHAAKHGVAIICPDTSPRGDDIADDADSWQLGTGAGFYVDATQEPWAKNYQMYSYITEELPALIAEEFAVDMGRQGIFGHSMGGHGALTIALSNSDTFKSCSAFAPIVSPSKAEWSMNAFRTYLGDNPAEWAKHDAVEMIKAGARFPELLVDQCEADGFLEEGLMPNLLVDACEDAGLPLKMRLQPGYNHSYFFISTFMADHIAWHAERL